MLRVQRTGADPVDGPVPGPDSSSGPGRGAGGHDLMIFDFDGTLADSFAVFVRVQRKLARQFGFRPVADDELALARGQSTTALIRASGLAPWQLPRVAAAYRRMTAEEGVVVACFPGVQRTLATLHDKGIQLALVSSNSERNCRAVLGETTWRLFDHTECGASLTGKHRRLLRVTARLRVPADRAIYIGDHPVDADAARAAGMAIGLVNWGYASPDAIAEARPDLVFSDPVEIEALASTQAVPRHRAP